MKKNFDSTIQRRITYVLLFFFVILAILLGRLFILQILHYRDFQAQAARQQHSTQSVAPERGSIFAQDKNGTLIPLALNRDKKVLVASPRSISHPENVAQILAQHFNLDESTLLAKLSRKNDAYEILSKTVDDAVIASLNGMIPEGISFENRSERVYPHGTVGAQVLGFASTQDQTEEGRYGIERQYDKQLFGAAGLFEGAKDAAGFWVALGRKIINPPKNGSTIVLSLDFNIQQKSEEVLKGLIEKWNASSGSVLVMEPHTGRILAEASYPTFDPNQFSKEKNFSVFLDPIVESSYELGSVLKPITMAEGIETGVVTPTSTYVDTGVVQIGGLTVKNFDNKANGVQTMTQVLEKSLNTGIVHVAELIGKEKELQNFENFGLGEKTGINLPGEVSGNISNLLTQRDIDYATAAYGQGIAVTPLQLASAIGALANGGTLMTPYVVDKITDDAGNVTTFGPQIRRHAISSTTAETLTKMLVAVVQGKFDSHAGVKGYFVAGKTGTAQVPNKGRRGYSSEVIHTFAGYAPAFNPKFLILLKMDEPHGNLFAANTLTPGFHDLAEYILNYYEIPPDQNINTK